MLQVLLFLCVVKSSEYLQARSFPLPPRTHAHTHTHYSLEYARHSSSFLYVRNGEEESSIASTCCLTCRIGFLCVSKAKCEHRHLQVHPDLELMFHALLNGRAKSYVSSTGRSTHSRMHRRQSPTARWPIARCPVSQGATAVSMWCYTRLLCSS